MKTHKVAALPLIVLIVTLDSSNGSCNVCHAGNPTACHSQTVYSLCSYGVPTYDLIACPSNYVCTSQKNVCYPRETTNPFCQNETEPVGCGVCNDAKVFSCVDETTIVFCFGNDKPDDKSVGYCPEDTVCDLNSDKFCSEKNEVVPSCTTGKTTTANSTIAPAVEKLPTTRTKIATSISTEISIKTTKLEESISPLNTTQRPQTTIIATETPTITSTLTMVTTTPTKEWPITTITTTSTLHSSPQPTAKPAKTENAPATEPKLTTTVAPTTNTPLTATTSTTSKIITSNPSTSNTSTERAETTFLTTKESTATTTVAQTKSTITTKAITTTTPTTIMESTESIRTPEQLCSEMQANSVYKADGDATCKKYVLCYKSNGAWTGIEKKCTSRQYFHEDRNICSSEKPAGCN